MPGVVATPAWKRRYKGLSWYPGDTVMAGIGQSFTQVTALQLAAGTATIANKGIRYIPHLVRGEQTLNQPFELHTPKTLPPVVLRDNTIWTIIINGMQGVITSHEGTGFRFGKIGPYTVAAKTGTAQVHSIKNYNSHEDHEDQSKLPERLRDNSLFIAFAPVEKPQIAIAINVENANQAAIIARKILDYYLLGLPVLRDPLTKHILENTNHATQKTG